MAKIVVIGASGTIGRAVAGRLDEDHEVIRVGRRQGDLTVDIANKESIETLFDNIGRFDAVICAAGHSRFTALLAASDEDFSAGIENKLMGQINVSRTAPGYLPGDGAIVLTSGLLAREPWPGTVPTAMVNAGLEGFVRAAALDLPQGMRINAVSPIFVTETAVKMGMDTAGTMSSTETAIAYQTALQESMNGQVLDVRDYGRISGR